MRQLQQLRELLSAARLRSVFFFIGLMMMMRLQLLLQAMLAVQAAVGVGQKARGPAEHEQEELDGDSCRTSQYDSYMLFQR